MRRMSLDSNDPQVKAYLEALSEGLTRRNAAAESGIVYTDLRELRAKDDDFGHLESKAEAKASGAIDRGLARAAKGGSPKAAELWKQQRERDELEDTSAPDQIRPQHIALLVPQCDDNASEVHRQAVSLYGEDRVPSRTTITRWVRAMRERWQDENILPIAQWRGALVLSQALLHSQALVFYMRTADPKHGQVATMAARNLANVLGLTEPEVLAQIIQVQGDVNIGDRARDLTPEQAMDLLQQYR